MTVFFFKQKTAYEMRISDWSSDVCSSDLTYTGSGGVSIGNWFNRLAFAAKYTERNILFSSAIGSNSKIIFKRDPKERVEEVATWLKTDGAARSEERRGGKECGSTCSARGAAYHLKKNKQIIRKRQS